MNSLLLRIFLAFWLIIGITIGAAAIAGYWYAGSVREAYEQFEIGDDLLDASAALQSAGREGLAVWLRNYPESRGFRLLIFDDRRRELLGRSIPRHLLATLGRLRGIQSAQDRAGRDPENVLRARSLTQLIGPDGTRYTFVLVPARGGPFALRDSPLRGLLPVLAVFISAIVSYFLARTISRPVRMLRSATGQIADGKLDARVDRSVAQRRDELGSLARAFDGMAASLEKAADRQSELSRHVSHELRSPLARLRVALELARQRIGNTKELDRIDAESERLDALIGQILSFSRMDSLAADQFAETDLRELLGEVVDDANFECEAAGHEDISVELLIPEQISICLHRDSIRSAVENIVRNAIRHTASPSKISVSANCEGELVLIEICDRGPGVDPADLERLFDPFFRTPGTQHDGSGLGLAIARRAVEGHGGSISASNRPQGGLCVRISLSAAQPARPIQPRLLR